MGSKAKAPPPPDYTKLAQEQARLQNEMLDKQTANNRVNQSNPLGSVQWEQDPVTGQWVQKETWTPELMQAYQDQLGWAGTQRDYESERMDFERSRMAQESERMQQQMGYDKQRADYEVEQMQRSGAFEKDLMEFERNRMANETGRMGKQNIYDDARAAYNTGQMADSAEYNKKRMGYEDQKMGWAGEQMGFARDQMDMVRSFMDKMKGMEQGPAFNGGPGVPSYDGGYDSGYAQNFAKSALMRVLPQQAREQEALTNKLRLQGLQPGTEGFNRAYSQMVTAHGDVQAKAQIDGQLAGTEQARESYLAQLQGQGQGFDQSMKSYLLPWQVLQMQAGSMQGLGNGIGAGIGQGIGGDIFGNPGDDVYGGAGQGIAYGLGQNPGGEDIYSGAGQGIGSGYGSSIGGPAAPDYQGYTPAGMGQAPEILNAAQQTYAQQMQQYNEKMKQSSGKGGAIGSIAGAAAGSFFPGVGTVFGSKLGSGLGSMFSDMRLKSDVEPLSDEECYEKLKAIIPISWRWNGTSVVDSGISAQQILEELPHLTDRTERGLLAVNYTALFAMLLGGFRHLASKQESENAAV